MKLIQVLRMTTVRLAEEVKSSTDYGIQFVSKPKDSKPEKVFLTHLAKNFQRQVRIEDVTHETKTAVTTASMIAKKTNERYKM